MKKLFIFISIAAVLAIAWWLISPIFLNKTVNEDLAFEFGDIKMTYEEMEGMSASEAEDLEQQIMEEAALMPDIVMEEDMPTARDAVVRRGVFQDADEAHQATGDAILIESGEEKILRLENLDVTNGPDLRVLLSTSDNPNSRDTLGEYIELDRLKGNMGNQNYTIDGDIDLSQYKSVVIYCKPFHVVFGTAIFQ